MDSAYPYFGGKHRVFWHDTVSACAIAAEEYPGDENAVSSALLHIEEDNMCSSNPLFHEQLKLLAAQDAKKRKKSKKSPNKKRVKPKKEKTAPPDELEKFNEFLEDLAEIHRLARLIRS